MSKKVLIIKNKSHEGLGLIRNILEEHSLSFEIIDLDAGEKFPPLDIYSALIILGGPDSANDDTEKIKTELKRVQEALDMQIPYLGICLGMQILAKAAGGSIEKNHIEEVGIRDPEGDKFAVELTQAGQNDELFIGAPHSFPVCQAHVETAVKLGETTVSLGIGKHCKHQVIKVGKSAYGLQFHLELIFQKLQDEWIEKTDLFQELDHEKLLQDFADLEKTHVDLGQIVFQNFFRIAGLL